ncbi:MAG: hypothetical protein IPG32_03525 [Saprospirales bacterium]|nr:hypothetical protein [Saprospirales bacterium]
MGLITLFKPANDIDREVIETANLGDFDLLIIGIGKSVYEGHSPGKVTRIYHPDHQSRKTLPDLTGKEKLFGIFGVGRPLPLYSALGQNPPWEFFCTRASPKIENVFIPFTGRRQFPAGLRPKTDPRQRGKVVILDVNGAHPAGPRN